MINRRNITGNSISCQRLRKAAAKKEKKNRIHKKVCRFFCCTFVVKWLFMKRVIFFYLLLFSVSLSARVSLQSATRMEVNATYDSLIDPVMRGVMDQYQYQLSEAVNRTIGTSTRLMTASAPESYLSNLLSDLLLSQANTRSEQPMEVAIINLGGIRAPLKEGPVTVGDIYKIMPFENELVLLTLKGEDLKAIFDHLAVSGGEGLAGATLEIKAGKATRILIGGQPLDEARLYKVATMDYLAAGNSGMTAFLKAVERIDTHLKVRDCYIEQIERLTAAGKALDAKLDGRIRVLAD